MSEYVMEMVIKWIRLWNRYDGKYSEEDGTAKDWCKGKSLLPIRGDDIFLWQS